MKPLDIISHYSSEPQDDITLQAITHNFQLHFPGNYTLSWNASLGGVDIKFDDPEEQTIWMLKWM